MAHTVLRSRSFQASIQIKRLVLTVAPALRGPSAAISLLPRVGRSKIVEVLIRDPLGYTADNVISAFGMEVVSGDVTLVDIKRGTCCNYHNAEGGEFAYCDRRYRQKTLFA
jgi:hypothetical protein